MQSAFLSPRLIVYLLGTQNLARSQRLGRDSSSAPGRLTRHALLNGAENSGPVPFRTVLMGSLGSLC